MSTFRYRYRSLREKSAGKTSVPRVFSVDPAFRSVIDEAFAGWNGVSNFEVELAGASSYADLAPQTSYNAVYSTIPEEAAEFPYVSRRYSDANGDGLVNELDYEYIAAYVKRYGHMDLPSPGQGSLPVDAVFYNGALYPKCSRETAHVFFMEHLPSSVVIQDEITDTMVPTNRASPHHARITDDFDYTLYQTASHELGHVAGLGHMSALTVFYPSLMIEYGGLELGGHSLRHWWDVGSSISDSDDIATGWDPLSTLVSESPRGRFRPHLADIDTLVGLHGGGRRWASLSVINLTSAEVVDVHAGGGRFPGDRAPLSSWAGSSED